MGRRGWFWEAWSGREPWHRSRVPAEEVSRIPAAFLDEERRTLPGLVFASEYECEFVDPLARVFASDLSLPGTEATVRGFSADLLVIDEAARVDDSLYEAVRPMLAVTGGRLVALSTPWGRRGWFWEAWSGREPWHRSRVPAEEVSRIPAAFLDEERRTLPGLVFASEYECEFVDPLARVFASDDVLAALDDDLVPLFGAPA